MLFASLTKFLIRVEWSLWCGIAWVIDLIAMNVIHVGLNVGVASTIRKCDRIY